MGESKLVDTDKGWNSFFAAVRAMRGETYVKVGVLGDSDRGGMHKVDPKTGKPEPLTTAEIAAVNEFGTKDGRIPPRPAFRGTFDKMREELVHDFAHVLGKALLGEMSLDQGLNALGMKLAAEIRKTITAGSQVPPPNAASTVREKEAHGTTAGARAKKWGVRTLVDTGAEIGAISWALVREGTQHAAKYLSGSSGASGGAE